MPSGSAVPKPSQFFGQKTCAVGTFYMLTGMRDRFLDAAAPWTASGPAGVQTHAPPNTNLPEVRAGRSYTPGP